MLYYAAAGLLFAAAEGEVYIVQEPAEKFYGVGLVEEIEAFVGLAGNLLQEFVWGDVGLKGAGVPYFADQDREALDELRSLRQVFEHEKVPQRRYVG